METTTRRQNNLNAIVRVQSKRVSYKVENAEPIAHNDVDDVYIFYTPSDRLVQSATYDEAKAKWLLTKETD